MHLTSSPAIWYAARAAGVAAYIVLTIGVTLGLTLGRKAQSKRWPRFAVEDVHRFAGLLVGSLIAVHVLAIAADAFLPFSLVQLVVPLTATYRPLWTGFGIFAAELLIALAITNHYRERISYRFWRRAHYLNFAVWVAATGHGMLAGTDRGAPWLALVYGAAIGSVAATAAWRFARIRLWSGRFALTGLAAAALPVALLFGPLQKSPRPWNAAQVSEQLTGQVVQNGTQVKEIVSFVGGAESPQRLLVRADLLVSPASLEATSLQLEYLPSGDICRGSVTTVGGTSFTGRCSLRGGAERFVDASWEPSPDGGVVGTITLHA